MAAIICSNELVGLVDSEDLKLFPRVYRNSEMSLTLDGQDAGLNSLVLRHGTDFAFQKASPLLGWAEVAVGSKVRLISLCAMALLYPPYYSERQKSGRKLIQNLLGLVSLLDGTEQVGTPI